MVDYNTTQQHTREHVSHATSQAYCVGGAYDTRITNGAYSILDVIDLSDDIELNEMFVMRDRRDDMDNDPAFAPSTDECEERRAHATHVNARTQHIGDDMQHTGIMTLDALIKRLQRVQRMHKHRKRCVVCVAPVTTPQTDDVLLPLRVRLIDDAYETVCVIDAEYEDHGS